MKPMAGQAKTFDVKFYSIPLDLALFPFLSLLQNLYHCIIPWQHDIFSVSDLFIYCQHELISPLFPETTVTASKT